MNKDVISTLPTEFLHGMLKDIRVELGRRRSDDGKQKRRGFISGLDLSRYETATQANIDVIKYNSSATLALPQLSKPAIERTFYLPSLIAQDWSETFPESGGEPKYYVYVHVDPSGKVVAARADSGGNFGGLPFYVGKGTGKRAHDLKRNQGHGKKIKEVLGVGWAPNDIVTICFDGLTESKAYEIESKLVYFFGSIYERDRKGILYNLDVPSKPVFAGSMRKRVLNRQMDVKSLNSHDKTTYTE